MFFESKIVKALKSDHGLMRKHLDTLRDGSASAFEMKSALSRLIPLLRAHITAEEQVVYSYMKVCRDDDLHTLKQFSFEGQEEHAMMDEVLEKMLRDEGGTEKWYAQAKVLAKLVEHHLDEEELDIFPKLNRALDAIADERLVTHYDNVRSAQPFSVRAKAKREAPEARLH